MSSKELERCRVIQHLIDGLITVADAAFELQLSERQIFRLKAGVMKEGLSFLVHKNRGRKPKHALPKPLKDQVISLATGKYSGANDCHLTELLADYEGIKISVPSVRRILRGAGIPSTRKRRAPKKHRLRERRQREGELLQIDASPHHWLGPDLERFTLVGSIDDATGKITGAIFRPKEDLEGYFEVLRQTITTYGVPGGIYSDRHTIFVSPKAEKLTIEQELEGQCAPLTQFGQALSTLRIAHLKARSPQAKGRVERLWQTLQDRLAFELQLAGITTIADANAFLPGFIERYNLRFSVEPADPVPYYGPAPSPKDLALILCRKEDRSVSAAGTISFQNQLYQLVVDGRPIPTRAKTKATVCILSSGTPVAIYNGKICTLQAVPKSSSKAVEPKEKAGLALPPRKPAPDHPWRRWVNRSTSHSTSSSAT